MNWRLKASVFLSIVAFATMAWTPCASAGIIFDSSVLTQALPGGSSSGMSAPLCPTDMPCVPLDRGGGLPILEDLLSHACAGAPPTTSAETTVNGVTAFDAVACVPPLQLVARLLTDLSLLLPPPPLSDLLHVPRCVRRCD